MDQLHTILIIEQVLHGLVAESYRLLHLDDRRLRFGVSHRLCRLGGRSVILNAERIKDTLGVCDAERLLLCLVPACAASALVSTNTPRRLLPDTWYRAQTHNNRRAGPVGSCSRESSGRS